MNGKHFWTSNEGTYDTNLKGGNYEVHVSMIGFRDVDTIIDLDRDRVLDFTLTESVTGLEEVLLEGHMHKKTSQQVVYVDDEYLEKQFNGSLASSLERRKWDQTGRAAMGS